MEETKKENFIELL